MAKGRKRKPNITDGNDCCRGLGNIWLAIKSYVGDLASPLRYLTDVGVFTFVLAVVAGLQLLTMEKTDRTLRAQQRAWLEPTEVTFATGLKRGEPLVYSLGFVNVGREPATGVVMQGGEKLRTEIVPANGVVNGYFSGKNEWCGASSPNENGYVAWPSRSGNVTISADPPAGGMEDVWAGRKYLTIEGCFGYATIGEKRFSAFCFYTRPTPGLPIDEWPVLTCMNHHFAE